MNCVLSGTILTIVKSYIPLSRRKVLLMGYLAEKALGLRVEDDKRPPLDITLSFEDPFNE